MSRSIVFVCLGNICRSPLAEGIAKKIVQEQELDIRVESRGTGNWHVGEKACENSIKVARQNGIDISKHHARQITTRDLEEFDTIIALDSNNYNDLVQMKANNLSKLGDYGFNGEDVPDPYFFHGFEGFEKVYRMIETCVKKLIGEKI